MKSRPIIQIDDNKENPLRMVARLVTKEEFGTPFLKDILKDMEKALSKESDGVAIAAPQIGVSLRIFVVSPNAYEEDAKFKPLVFINPKILKRSKKTAVMQEGCLSVRWIYGKTKRSIDAKVEAYDVDGNKFTYGGGGLLGCRRKVGTPFLRSSAAPMFDSLFRPVGEEKTMNPGYRLECWNISYSLFHHAVGSAHDDT